MYNEVLLRLSTVGQVPLSSLALIGARAAKKPERLELSLLAADRFTVKVNDDTDSAVTVIYYTVRYTGCTQKYGG